MPSPDRRHLAASVSLSLPLLPALAPRADVTGRGPPIAPPDGGGQPCAGSWASISGWP